MEKVKNLENLSTFKMKEAQTSNVKGGGVSSPCAQKIAGKWTQCYNDETYVMSDGRPKAVDCD